MSSWNHGDKSSLASGPTAEPPKVQNLSNRNQSRPLKTTGIYVCLGGGAHLLGKCMHVIQSICLIKHLKIRPFKDSLSAFVCVWETQKRNCMSARTAGISWTCLSVFYLSVCICVCIWMSCSGCKRFPMTLMQVSPWHTKRNFLFILCLKCGLNGRTLWNNLRNLVVFTCWYQTVSYCVLGCVWVVEMNESMGVLLI